LRCSVRASSRRGRLEMIYSATNHGQSLAIDHAFAKQIDSSSHL
jgi:hypothetical protein